MALRLNLYEIQTEIYGELCERLDIEVIPPPLSAVDENGFLKSEFQNNDPTHGNARYGGLVWQQLQETMSVE